MLAVFTFLAGRRCCSSRAPRRRRRDGWSCLDRVLPLGVIEVSHFLGSVVGAALLVLSQGLARRLDAAYYLTAVAMVVGMAASLLKGFDYEEATLLLAACCWCCGGRDRPSTAARRSSRRGSRRRGSRRSSARSARRCGSALFAFKHVDYSRELWWQFELQGEASRFLRGSGRRGDRARCCSGSRG